MELDLYNTNEVEDGPIRLDYEPSSDATYYPVSTNDSDVKILPIANIIFNDDHIEIVLYQLKRAFNSSTYDPTTVTQKNLHSLNLKLREIFEKFQSHQAMKPIKVREDIVINNPSPDIPSIPSLVGLGSAAINIYPTLTDYLYTVIDGLDRLALSIYFGYNHIPVVVRV